MKARIEFEVEDEEEFEKIKDASQLPDEVWTLIEPSNSNRTTL